MGTIYYFAPKISGINNDKIISLGAGHIVPENCGPDTLQGEGPEGLGVFFAYPGCDGDTKLQQAVKSGIDWVKSGNIYAGLSSEHIPVPEDLERAQQALGNTVKLGDDNKWNIPAARLLPKTIVKEGGEWKEGGVVKKHRKMFDLAEKLWDDYAAVGKLEDDNPELKVSFSDGIDLAVMALSLNYRVGDTEIQMLSLINTDVMTSFYNAILDFPFWVEFLKKNSLEQFPPAEEQDLTDGEKD